MPDRELKGDGKKFTTSHGPYNDTSPDDRGGDVPEITGDNKFGTGYGKSIPSGTEGPGANGAGVGEVAGRNYSDKPPSAPAPYKTKGGVNQSLRKS